jgi:hypothetical protein
MDNLAKFGYILRIMKNQKTIIIVTAVALITLGILFGVRQNQLADADRLIQDPDLTNALLAEQVVFKGEQYLIPPGEIYEYGSGIDGAEPINNPTFVSVNEADEVIADGLMGIDVEVDGDHRFYPVQILNWHQVVNDEFNGKQLLVSFDLLTFSDRVYEATEDFGHSGKVYNNNALLYDKSTQSLWLQSRGIAVSGNRIGEELDRYPSISIKWEDWKELYPDGEVLSTETESIRDYTRHPFGVYDEAEIIYFPLQDTDTRISSKWHTYGISINDEQKAYVQRIMQGIGAANDVVGGEVIVAFYDGKFDITRVFSRVSDGVELTFQYNFADGRIKDDQTGSFWTAGGLAISGELEGTQLEPIQTDHSFWFSWSVNYPNSTILGIDEDSTLSE